MPLIENTSTSIYAVKLEGMVYIDLMLPTKFGLSNIHHNIFNTVVDCMPWSGEYSSKVFRNNYPRLRVCRGAGHSQLDMS